MRKRAPRECRTFLLVRSSISIREIRGIARVQGPKIRGTQFRDAFGTALLLNFRKMTENLTRKTLGWREIVRISESIEKCI